MRVNTIQQFKILKYLRETFNMDKLRPVIINDNTIRVFDRVGDFIDFKYENDKINSYSSVK